MKKITISILLVVLTGGLLLGPATQQSALGQDKVVKLTFWPFGGLEWEKAWLREKTKEFNESHPNIQVKYVHQSWSGGRQKIISSSELGTLADIFSIEATVAGEYSKMGIIVPLDKRFPEDTKKILDRLNPKVRKVGQAGGHTYGLPLYVDLVSPITYNPDIIEEAGLDPDNPPKTLDELLQWAKQIKKETGKPAWEFQLKQTGAYYAFLQTYTPLIGMRVLDKKKGEILFDTPQYKKLLEWALDMKKAGVLPKGFESLSYMDHARMFFSGQLAMFSSGTFMGGLAKDLGAPKNLKWRYAPLPLAPKSWRGPYRTFQTRVTSGSTLFLNKNSDHIEEAWEFVKFLMSDEVLKAWGRNPGRIPVSQKVLNSSEFKKNKEGLYKAIHDLNLLKTAGYAERFAGQTEVHSIFARYFQKVMAGKISIEKALEKADKEAQKAYDQYKH